VEYFYCIKEMIVNVVIPCCSLHRKYLQDTFKSIYEQSVQPDRIICVLNEYTRYKKSFDEIIEKNNKIEYIKCDEWNVAGINRKIGTDKVKEGIIIYQDADDIMYKDRIEKIIYFFDKYNCSLLVHLHDHSFQKRNYKNNEDIEYILSNEINDTLEKETRAFSKITSNKREWCEYGRDLPEHNPRWGEFFGNRENKNKCSKIHHGNCAVNSNIFNNEEKPFWIERPTGQDVFFVNEVTRVYKNSMIILYPLIMTIGNEHYRRYGNKILKKKRQKDSNYTLYDTRDEKTGTVIKI